MLYVLIKKYAKFCDFVIIEKISPGVIKGARRENFLHYGDD